jgi:hypothetical protein
MAKKFTRNVVKIDDIRQIDTSKHSELDMFTDSVDTYILTQGVLVNLTDNNGTFPSKMGKNVTSNRNDINAIISLRDTPEIKTVEIDGTGLYMNRIQSNKLYSYWISGEAAYNLTIDDNTLLASTSDFPELLKYQGQPLHTTVFQLKNTGMANGGLASVDNTGIKPVQGTKIDLDEGDSFAFDKLLILI